MNLRRFEQFQLGALNAARLNEMLDAIADLQRRVAMMPMAAEPMRDTILVRITGSPTALRTEGCEGGPGVAAVSYPFGEVTVSIKPDGNPTSSSCMSFDFVEGGIGNQRGAVLLALEDTPSLEPGRVVMAHYCAGALSFDSDSRKMIYVAATGGGGGEAKLYSIVGYDDFGRYEARIVDQPTTEPIILLNVYELSQYYSALGPPQNPCAELEPRRLVPGDLVIGFKIGPLHYTCAPTSFTVTCVNCGGTPLGIAALYTESGAQSAVASQMLGG